MKFLTFVTSVSLITVSSCSLIQRRAASSSHSKESSISTVYSFLGASGTETNLLQMPTSALSLESQSSSSIDESSALSQFLNGAAASKTATPASSQTMIESLPITTSGSGTSPAVETDGDKMPSESGSMASTAMVSSNQQSSSSEHSTASFATVSTAAASSNNSSSIASGGANTLGLPLLAGGVAGMIALII